MDLQLSARASKACTVVEVGGQLDMDTAPLLDEFLQRVGAVQVVLDFADVSFMDSSGLGVLMVWFKELRGRGGAVVCRRDAGAGRVRAAGVRGRPGARRVRHGGGGRGGHAAADDVNGAPRQR
ncbi:anti-sigma B factor antagonist [Paractinoplanes brasiliensis]|uniref:Anti-sigma B factor antagonist n=1 Tax=Paractinoplanes brasiliensis TaxID=52695 RepID=A0A4V3C7Z4_9ACTN|nr:anti-sigma B factor antagonist [Actinoplanes brasiliensis]